ncbi:MAG: hypothetical protein GIX03_08385 [Candidatus Eremiobacteraeota bacterium]|nr:hypothetical protein [Candidatus Eremiobacteraeota bacterium]MBC5803002.1 hypothetical protein [Candidatus Eremiobacteraeota bacterium]MBC5823176.1 hypothetical protein [Candidatus Eremiobacteraeota bacterium]
MADATTSLPKGTPVVVQTYNAINSATFHVGEHLAYTVTDDVIVNGAIVAKAGDRASGVVEDAVQGRKVRAGRAGMLLGPVGAVAGGAANRVASKGADLRVSVDKLQSFCGATIDLSFVRSEYHKPKRFSKMTSVEIAKGQKYVATVARDSTVCSEPTTKSAAPIPSDALRADNS